MKEVMEYFNKESSLYEKIRWRGNFVSQYDFKVTKKALTSIVSESDFLVDLGCGPGTWLKEFHKNHKICVGIDISHEMIRLCQKKNLPNVDLIIADCHNLPFQDRVFDTILSSRVFIYLDFEKALKEADRILKENGSAILLIQIKRQSLYFNLRESLKKSVKFLENTNYLRAQTLLEKVSRHFQITQIIGVIYREHISQQALDLKPIAFLLNLYLMMLYPLEKMFSASFLKYFYASSLAIKVNKMEELASEWVLKKR